jgi:hypothetical protein
MPPSFEYSRRLTVADVMNENDEKEEKKDEDISEVESQSNRLYHGIKGSELIA